MGPPRYCIGLGMKRILLGLAVILCAAGQTVGCATSSNIERTPEATVTATPSQPATAEATGLTLEAIWSDLDCTGSTSGVQQEGNYYDRAGTCKIRPGLSNIYFWEFPTVGALNTGLSMDLLEVREDPGFFTSENIAMLGGDVASRMVLMSMYGEVAETEAAGNSDLLEILSIATLEQVYVTTVREELGAEIEDVSDEALVSLAWTVCETLENGVSISVIEQAFKDQLFSREAIIQLIVGPTAALCSQHAAQVLEGW